MDNLHAEPLIARWIRIHVPGWKDAVVVSKNPGGTKRVTSLADALKLNFGLVTTDRRRVPKNGMNGSTMLEGNGYLESLGDAAYGIDHSSVAETEAESQMDPMACAEESSSQRRSPPGVRAQSSGITPTNTSSPRPVNPIRSSPLQQSTRIDSTSPPTSRTPLHVGSADTARVVSSGSDGDLTDEYTDERAREVITGRLIHGHIVDDDFSSPVMSTMSGSIATLPGEGTGHSNQDDGDPMTSSFISTTSMAGPEHALGGTFDAAAISDEEEEGFQNPELEHTITLVGNVRDKVVFVMDDMIDSPGSWIAAAETVVKRGGAKKVYCIATHGLFGEDSLEKMEDCECIDFIVVTNSYPISLERVKASKKLVILDLSNLLSEAIRRNHYGESISQLFQHYQD